MAKILHNRAVSIFQYLTLKLLKNKRGYNFLNFSASSDADYKCMSVPRTPDQSMTLSLSQIFLIYMRKVIKKSTVSRPTPLEFSLLCRI